MPGNGVGDRVHNFFAQENLPQGLRSQDENWSLNDNSWVSNHKQFGVSDSSPRNYNAQQSETERGHDGQRVPDQYMFNITQTNARPEFARSPSQSRHEQPNSNGYMYGRQNFQTRPDEANYMGVNTEYDQNNANQRGFPFHESQQGPVTEQPAKNLFRSETSDAHGSFDLFGGQHQTNSQFPGLLQQPLQQQPGFNDTQQLQQQLMLRKMQELQRQQEIQKQQNALNQASQFARQQEIQKQQSAINQASHFARQQEIQKQNAINHASQFARQQEIQKQQNALNQFARQQEFQKQQNALGQASQFARQQEIQRQQNSLNQASQFARQQASGSLSHGLVNGTPTSDSSGYGWTEPAGINSNWLQRASPALHAEPQAEPSLHGVPVSSSRGPVNQYPHNNSVTGNNLTVVPEQHKGLFGNTFSQGSSIRMKMDNIQQINALPNPSVQESPLELVQDESATDAAPLDPEEEKILFGSDDNIWEAFGSSKNMTGGMSSLLDDNEFASGLPSMQSGSWSALMQSAVAETTSDGGVGLKGELPDTNFRNPELSGRNSYEGSGKHRTQTNFTDINLPNMNDKHYRNMGFHHSSGGSNWLHRGDMQKVAAEESRLYENSVPGQRTPQQHGPPDNKNSNWSANEPVPPPMKSGFNVNENDSSLQQSQNNDWKRVNSAAISQLSNLQQGVNHFNQFSPNNHHLNHWKHVESSVKSKGSESSEISQRRVNNKGPQVSESSFNSSDKEDLNSSRKENSNDSYRSSSSHLPNTVGQREHLSSDAGDSRSLAGTKQSLSNKAGQKIPGSVLGPGPRKFQYHPMGNLDEDVGVPYGTRQGVNTNSVSLQHSRGLGAQDQGSFGLTKNSGQGFVPEVGGLKGSDDMHFKGMVPGHRPNIFTSHDRSVGLTRPDKASQPSQNQNMLELLHKVDLSRDGGIARNLNSLDRNFSSEIPEPENSDGSFGGHQRSQSSNSQGIGLQLGPPSQRLPMATQAAKNNSLSQSQLSANSRGKGHAELSTPFQETSHGELKSDRMSISGQSERQTMGNKMMANFSAALGGTDFPNSRNHFQKCPTAGSEYIDGPASQIRQADERVQHLHSLTGEKLHAPHPHASSGVSRQGAFPKMLSNASSNLLSQQVLSATQPGKSQFNIVESTSIGQQNLEEQGSEKTGNKSSLNAQGSNTSVGEMSTEKVDVGQMINGPAAGNDSSTASQKDLEAFGRSLKPNNFHQQISLLNQMKAYKHTDNDPNNIVLNRLKDSGNLLRGQQISVSPGNSEMPRSTLPTDSVERNLASLPMMPSNASNQNGPPFVKTENSHISPQMAPSWFDQYGTLKTGQISSQRADAIRTVGPPFKVSGSLETTAHVSKEPPPSGATADTSKDGVIWRTPVPSSVVPHFTSQPLQPSIAVQNLVTLRPKKRKWSRDEISSWLKEVSGSSKNLQGIWSASIEWCEATKRLMEKVDGDGELIEDVRRPKRRIILATQLMQQLFPPPPPALLSTEANSNYESVAFYAARLALGDACNLVSCVSRKSNLIADKSTESEKVEDNRLAESVEDYQSKAKRIAADFSRLDKRASILDFRVECQDLEKFSIINRFAKYHGRGQADGESSSLSDAAVNAPKPHPQRYVVAVPLPKNLPERVQCLSL